MKKQELRQIYQQKRENISPKEAILLSERINKHIIRQFEWQKIQNIHLFLPIKDKKEVDLWGFIRWIFSEMPEKSLFIPKIIGNELKSCLLTPETQLKTNRWGILEATEPPVSENTPFDLVITPLLYADNQGNRVGYGKGFYDRFFLKINDNAVKLGVNFFPPNEPISDIFSQDIPLDILVTPEKVFSFQDKRTDKNKFSENI